jgi:hypothetical protein
MSETRKIICTHPQGLVLHDKHTRVELGRPVNGHSVTSVDAAFWERWLRTHAGHPLVINGVVRELPEATLQTASSDASPAPKKGAPKTKTAKAK